MTRPSHHELVELADRNLAESIREHARWSSRAVLDEQPFGVRTLGATRFSVGVFNAVMCTGATPSDPDEWLAEQRRFYDQQQRGFTIYGRMERDRLLADVCLGSGLTLASVEPGMACDAPIAEPPDDPRIRTEQVTTPEALTELIALCATGFATLGLPASVTHKVMGEPERMLGDHVLWFLTRFEGAPAATAMVLFSDTIAGIYWVSCHPDWRKRGLAAACTRAATNAAFERGARAVVLQATRMGEPTYLKLGYREITRYPQYLSYRAGSEPA